MNDLKAIFFDLDNVLVYSEMMHFQAWQETVKFFDIDPNAIIFENLIGINDLTQSKLIKEEFNINEDAITLWELKRKAFHQLSQTGFVSPKGRDQFLDKVKQHFITGIVSSSGVNVIQNVLSIENITNFFQFIIGQEDCERHKPDPMPYLKALEIARVKPEEALIIEDSPTGIQAAKNAGIPVIGILKDQRPDQILKDVQYFNDFEEVYNWLFMADTV